MAEDNVHTTGLHTAASNLRGTDVQTGLTLVPSMPQMCKKIKIKGFHCPPFGSTVGGTEAGVGVSERTRGLERNPLRPAPRRRW